MARNRTQVVGTAAIATLATDAQRAEEEAARVAKQEEQKQKEEKATKLSAKEKSALAAAEAELTASFVSGWRAQAKALFVIFSGKLYRAFGTWDQYLEARWPNVITRQHSNRLIRAMQATANLPSPERMTLNTAIALESVRIFSRDSGGNVLKDKGREVIDENGTAAARAAAWQEGLKSKALLVTSGSIPGAKASTGARGPRQAPAGRSSSWGTLGEVEEAWMREQGFLDAAALFAFLQQLKRMAGPVPLASYISQQVARAGRQAPAATPPAAPAVVTPPAAIPPQPAALAPKAPTAAQAKKAKAEAAAARLRAEEKSKAEAAAIAQATADREATELAAAAAKQVPPAEESPAVVSTPSPAGARRMAFEVTITRTDGRVESRIFPNETAAKDYSRAFVAAGQAYTSLATEMVAA